MFAAIRAGKPINNGEKAAASTLLALMGRTAAYTGEVITPEMILNSKQDLGPPRYEFGPLAMPPVPVPGPAEVCVEARPQLRVFATAFFRRSCKTLASGSTTILLGLERACDDDSL